MAAQDAQSILAGFAQDLLRLVILIAGTVKSSGDMKIVMTAIQFL